MPKLKKSYFYNYRRPKQSTLTQTRPLKNVNCFKVRKTKLKFFLDALFKNDASGDGRQEIFLYS